MGNNELSVHINADAEQVWRMLREPARTAQWHGWESDSLADEISQIYYTGVTEGPDHLSLHMAMGDVFTLKPVPDGTVLTMTRGKATGEWAPYDGDITAGWAMFIQQLRFALERHPHGTRRTIFADGMTSSARSLWEALGIDTGWLPEAGGDYSLQLSTGASLEGKVWYRSDTQLGLTVQSYAEHADGLLILAEQAPLKGIRPAKGAQVIASTYDLGAAAFESIAEQWDGFMEQHFPEG
ncbi:SRPBCC domain-containing protein [Paeniglutamicibacter antarcticus]|uniref:SRPBCC domain-containing protein n=1 Tax=Arthrobacter terrae TaxID=2935737 RepID=A0A931G3W8_9MICC|nr:SRPBCC domain-containing protein [Arthrobacter terrae]MBG0738178.1 SRPBCC domain-containing protein [Arthrobacter terrae]